MATNIKSGTKDGKQDKGTHGGNRAGGTSKSGDQPKKSSQAAGKDPHRGGKK